MIKHVTIRISREGNPAYCGTESYHKAYARLDKQSLRLFNVPPYGVILPDESLGESDGGFYKCHTGYHSWFKMEIKDKLFIGEIASIALRRRSDSLGKCERIVKYTKPQYSPATKGDISVCHPSYYRNMTALGIAADWSEGTLPVKPDYDFKCEFSDGTIEEIDNYTLRMCSDNCLVFCTSMASSYMESVHGKEKVSLAGRFRSEGNTSWTAFPVSSVNLFAFELAELIAYYSITKPLELYRDTAKMREWLKKKKMCASNSCDLWVTVCHGPVVYVDNRQSALAGADVVRNTFIDPMMTNFVKSRVSDTGVEYHIENEYRFCIYSSYEFRERQFIFPLSESMMDILKWSGSLA